MSDFLAVMLNIVGVFAVLAVFFLVIPWVAHGFAAYFDFVAETVKAWQ